MRLLTHNARVLFAVLTEPEKSQRQIARDLHMHYQHVWRALDRLVKEDLLCKSRVNRRTYFVPTEKFFEYKDIADLVSVIDQYMPSKDCYD